MLQIFLAKVFLLGYKGTSALLYVFFFPLCLSLQQVLSVFYWFVRKYKIWTFFHMVSGVESPLGRKIKKFLDIICIWSRARSFVIWNFFCHEYFGISFWSRLVKWSSRSPYYSTVCPHAV